MRSNRLVFGALIALSIAALLVAWSTTIGHDAGRALAQGSTNQSEEIVNRVVMISGRAMTDHTRIFLIDTTDGAVIGTYEYPEYVRVGITCSRDKLVVLPFGDPYSSSGMRRINIIDLVSGQIVATQTLELSGNLDYLWSCPPSDRNWR